MQGRFDRFTERARKVLTLAQEEAQRFNHNYIGPEHILLGLLRQGDGVAVKVLVNLGVEPEKLRGAVEVIIARGDHQAAGEIGLTLRAKKVIELAVDEARRMNHHYIGTEHLLLGLIREGESAAAGALETAGVTLESARAEVLRLLTQVAELGTSEETPQKRWRDWYEWLMGSESNEPSGYLGFDRFTERARKVLTLSQEEAQRFNHNYIGTEHLLLGLVREGEGVAAKTLLNLGVELTKVRSAVEFIIGRGERQVVGEIGLTPRAKKVVALARDEARRLNHHYIGTEHLLLGLIREGEGIAAGVLESMGVNLEKVRSEVLKVLTGTDSPPQQTPPTMEPAWSEYGRDVSPQHTPPPPPAPRAPRPPTWDYLVLTFSSEEGISRVVSAEGPVDEEIEGQPLAEILGTLGRLGWELVGMERAYPGATRYVFKRRGR